MNNYQFNFIVSMLFFILFEVEKTPFRWVWFGAAMGSGIIALMWAFVPKAVL